MEKNRRWFIILTSHRPHPLGLRSSSMITWKFSFSFVHAYYTTFLHLLPKMAFPRCIDWLAQARLLPVPVLSSVSNVRISSRKTCATYHKQGTYN